jgi:hypothetical protein
LTLFNDLGNQVSIQLGHLFDLGFSQAAILMGLNLVNNSPVLILLKFS